MKNYRLLMLLTVGGLAAFGCSNRASSHSDPRAVQIVDQCIEALGGLDAWKSLKDIHYRETRTRFENARSGGSVSTRDIYLKRNRSGRLMVRIEVTGGHLERLGPDGFPHGAPVDGYVVMGYDGDNYWETKDGVRVTDPVALESTRFVTAAWSYWFVIPFALKDPGVELHYKGEDSIDGEPVHLIEVTFAAGTGDNPEDRYLYAIHRETFMVENLRYWMKNRERHREFRMRNYVPVAGFLHDTLRVYYNHLGEQDGTKDTEIVSVDSGLDDALFRPGA